MNKEIQCIEIFLYPVEAFDSTSKCKQYGDRGIAGYLSVLH